MTVNFGDTTEQVMGTMREYEKMLSEKGFIRIHKGFLVNFRNIYSIEQKDVVLDDDQKLPLSRNRISETKDTIYVSALMVPLYYSGEILGRYVYGKAWNCRGILYYEKRSCKRSDQFQAN